LFLARRIGADLQESGNLTEGFPTMKNQRGLFSGDGVTGLAGNFSE